MIMKINNRSTGDKSKPSSVFTKKKRDKVVDNIVVYMEIMIDYLVDIKSILLFLKRE